MTTVNGVELPPGSSVLIVETRAEAEVIKAADIAAAAAAAAAESKE